METYNLLREIADSWVLLAMVLFFLAVAIWAFLPSQSKAREEARLIPFHDDTDDSGACDGTCADCAARTFSRSPEGIGDA